MSKDGEDEDECELHRLAFERRWPEMEERLASHPHEALLTAKHQCTALIVALRVAPRSPPPELVDAYLKVAPGAAGMYSRDGVPPLTFACHSACDPSIVVSLASAHPDATLYQNLQGRNVFHQCCRLLGEWGSKSSPIASILSTVQPDQVRSALLSLDQKGRAPIHIACGNHSSMPNSEFTALVHATPVGALQQSPLEYLLNQNAKALQQSLKNTKLPNKEISNGDPSLYCNERKVISEKSLWLWRHSESYILWRCLRKAFVLLGYRENEASTYPMLHSSLEMDRQCETFLAECILHLNPFYACQYRASDGALPIHVASRLARDATSKEASDKWKERIRKLLVLYPKGASISNLDGRFPLQLLVEPHGFATWSQVHLLLESHPVGISRLDLSEAMYPYLLAHLCKANRLDCVFEILCNTPSLIERR